MPASVAVASAEVLAAAFVVEVLAEVRCRASGLRHTDYAPDSLEPAEASAGVAYHLALEAFVAAASAEASAAEHLDIQS